MTRPELIVAFERLLARGSCWPAWPRPDRGVFARAVREAVMRAPPIALDILARQSEQVRQQVETLRLQAEKHRLAGTLDEFDRRTAEGYCDAIDLLLGQVWATFQNAAKKALTPKDIKEAAEAAKRA